LAPNTKGAADCAGAEGFFATSPLFSGFPAEDVLVPPNNGIDEDPPNSEEEDAVAGCWFAVVSGSSMLRRFFFWESPSSLS
jgi:hypothetical protein